MTEKTETALSSDVTEVRAQKLKLLRDQIGDVYPAHFHRTIDDLIAGRSLRDLIATSPVEPEAHDGS